jgi:L-glutamine-phosphate cytidylyltransferase
MNAIILAGGKSSSMYATGATVHKALLPIMGIPNIERTIMMLHDYHISDIIIAVSILNHDFDYLTKNILAELNIFLSKEKIPSIL